MKDRLNMPIPNLKASSPRQAAGCFFRCELSLNQAKLEHLTVDSTELRPCSSESPAFACGIHLNLPARIHGKLPARIRVLQFAPTPSAFPMFQETDTETHDHLSVVLVPDVGVKAC